MLFFIYHYIFKVLLSFYMEQFIFVCVLDATFLLFSIFYDLEFSTCHFTKCLHCYKLKCM